MELIIWLAGSLITFPFTLYVLFNYGSWLSDKDSRNVVLACEGGFLILVSALAASAWPLFIIGVPLAAAGWVLAKYAVKKGK